MRLLSIMLVAVLATGLVLAAGCHGNGHGALHSPSDDVAQAKRYEEPDRSVRGADFTRQELYTGEHYE